MSKSGISHCLRDLMEYYQNLVNKKNNVWEQFCFHTFLFNVTKVE
jgi:hypothetical protein